MKTTIKETMKGALLGLALAALLIIPPAVGYVLGQGQIVIGCLVYKKFDYKGLSFDCPMYVAPAALTEGGKK